LHNLQSINSFQGQTNGSNIINPPFSHVHSIPNSGSTIGTHNSMINVLNSLILNPGSTIGHMHMPPNFFPMPSSFSQNMFSDVVVSTDDYDLESIKITKLKTKLDTNCTICMGQMDKDEEVSELGCTHTFHTDCIKPYLQQYNYKCPVCRKEVGKAKYNI
jgi:hypothetical protein